MNCKKRKWRRAACKERAKSRKLSGRLVCAPTEVRTSCSPFTYEDRYCLTQDPFQTVRHACLHIKC
jgi:hypothetical protein